jgi:septum site-determining protein MinD
VQAGGGRFIVVFSTKGGVGKTVVATNLAASLAQRLRKPVCLLDLDLIAVGDACKMLNITARRSVADLMPALKRAAAEPTTPIPVEEVSVPHASGVQVVSFLTSPRQLIQLDPKALRVLFQALKRRYEYVIVDGGGNFSEPLIAAFDAANLILLVTSPDVLALSQAKWAMEMFQNLLFPSSMVKAVLNRAESRGGVDTRDALLVIPCEVIGQIPSDGHSVGTSVNQGVPLVSAFGSSKAAAAFFQLAELLIARQELFVTHQEIARHRQPIAPVAAPTQGTMWSNRLYVEGRADGTEESAVNEEVLLKHQIHQRLVEKLDLKRKELGSMINDDQMRDLRLETERVIADLLAEEVGGLAASHEARTRLVKEIADEALGLGPLEELLADPEVSDILVNNKDQIYVERRGKLELTPRRFVSNDLVRATIERIIAPLGRRIDESSPMVDARLPDGSRVNAIIPPLSLKGPVLSIRKFARTRYTEADLIRFNSLSPQMAQVLTACVIARKNMVITGGTGSGKTTLLNILSAAIPHGSRIITIEDAAELQLAQPHWLNLEARPPNIEGKGGITIRDLFRNALRMRPDRIIIGECRGAETLDMLQAMNTGHDGSLTTVHANSPRDAIARLDSMVLMSNVELPVRAIREMVASAIHLIVHTSRLSDGTRKITAITELVGLVDEMEIAFQDLFVFRQTGIGPNGAVLGSFVPTGKLPTFFDDFKVKGIELSAAMFS